MKNIVLIVVGALLIVGGISYYLISQNDAPVEYAKPVVPDLVEETPIPPTETTTPDITPAEEARGAQSIIGTSVENRDIVAYHFGTGTKEVLFIGGIHGGYSWNTALLGYELVDWFTANPSLVPDDVMVTIIPVLNPDGLEAVAGTAGKFAASNIKGSESELTAARFNAHKVDLNRNFACEWQAVGTWQNQQVSGGTEPFSEPESQALRDYVTTYKPAAAVTWYSSAGGVYSSNCKNGVSTATKEMTSLFASASGYTPYEEFDYYEITGDMVNWLASKNIPAISVLLTDHKNTELNKNEAGIKAILSLVAKTN